MLGSTPLQRDELHRLVVDNIAELVALVDGEGIVLYASCAHEQKLGYAAEALVGRALTELMHPRDLERVANAFSLCLATGRAPIGEFRLRHREGHCLQLDGALSVIATAQPTMLLVR